MPQELERYATVGRNVASESRLNFDRNCIECLLSITQAILGALHERKDNGHCQRGHKRGQSLLVPTAGHPSLHSILRCKAARFRLFHPAKMCCKDAAVQ